MLGYTSISGSRRPSASEESRDLKTNEIEETYQNFWCCGECDVRDLSRWRTADLSEICASDAAKVDDVVSRTRNYRLFGNRPAREACRCFKKMKLTSEDDVSALDNIL